MTIIGRSMRKRQLKHCTHRILLRSLAAGSLILPGLLSDLLAADDRQPDPLAPKQPHFEPKAKRVI